MLLSGDSESSTKAGCVGGCALGMEETLGKEMMAISSISAGLQGHYSPLSTFSLFLRRLRCFVDMSAPLFVEASEGDAETRAWFSVDVVESRGAVGEVAHREGTDAEGEDDESGV
jgi:hypothetical protein